MQLEIPMVATIKGKFDAEIEIDSVVDAKIRLWSSDDDKDGDPEFNLHIDLPGESFDQTFQVEIPVKTLFTSSLHQVMAFAIGKVVDFPGKGVVLAALKKLIGA